MSVLGCNAYIALYRKISRKRSQQGSSDRQREFSAQNSNTENDYDYIQNSDRRIAGRDGHDNFCKRAVADLGGHQPRFVSGAIPGPGCPEWRRAHACRQNGPGAASRCGSGLRGKERSCGDRPCDRLILRPEVRKVPVVLQKLQKSKINRRQKNLARSEA
jgi:hypothetical protein